MPAIYELVVKSKYSKLQSILTKTYEFDVENRIIDVIVHGEKLLNIDYKAFSNFIDIKIIIGVYFIYYRDNSGRKEPGAFFRDETVFIRVNKEEFKPELNDIDFSSGVFTPYIRNIKAKYDIDMCCKSISIDVTAQLVVNLVEEKTVVLREDKVYSGDDEIEEFEEIPLSSVAISRNYSGGDIRNYAITLEELSKAINEKLAEIEEEKLRLKKQIDMMKEEINNKNHQYLSLTEKFNTVSRDYTRQMEKLKSIENKYLKEQRKAGLLENENNKKIEEINQLLRDKNELISNIEKSKSKIRDRLKQIIYGK